MFRMNIGIVVVGRSTAMAKREATVHHHLVHLDRNKSCHKAKHDRTRAPAWLRAEAKSQN